MFNLEGFIRDCQAASREANPTGAVEALLQEAFREPAEVKRAFSSVGGGRELGATSLRDRAVFQSPELTVLGVAVAPGTSIAPHNHRMWAVVGVYEGREDNRFFRRGGKGLVEAGKKEVSALEVLVLGDEVIHSIANPLDSTLLAVHVYGGDLFSARRSLWDPDTFEESTYEWEQAFRGASQEGR